MFYLETIFMCAGTSFTSNAYFIIVYISFINQPAQDLWHKMQS